MTEEEQFIAEHTPHLRRRGGEEFEREPFTPGWDLLVCGCGVRITVPALPVDRELSTSEASDAVSSAFRTFIDKRFGERQ